ncbi:MAG: UDP-3-O-(3-hydroxymyristoyl)glucosamine N-acyltransferase [Alphaproteobacteria bacterium]
MADPRFYKKQGPFTLKELVSIGGEPIAGTYDDAVLIDDVASLEHAQAGQLTYCDNKKHIDHLAACQARAVLIAPALADVVPAHVMALIVKRPRRAFALMAQCFYPDSSLPQPMIAATAVIHPTATLGTGCCIDDYAIIGAGVSIGPSCHVGAHVCIGDGVQLGQGCRIEPFVNVQYALIGDFVTIQSGTKIGQAGFGFDMDESGFISIPQVGRVIIEDNVGIGANTTIDRGSGADTVIGAGSRIDNLVQIAHNVVLGKNCVLVAQVGIAGSTCLGNFVIAAGQVGIADHLKIGDGVRIAAQSGLMRDVEAGKTIAGSPAIAVRDWHRQTVMLQRLSNERRKQL